MAMKRIPFPVTDDDAWVSVPLEGLTPLLLNVAVYHKTHTWLFNNGNAGVMETVRRERDQTCKYCLRRKVSRIFLILTPTDEHRLRGCVVCETCADQMRLDVTS